MLIIITLNSPYMTHTSHFKPKEVLSFVICIHACMILILLRFFLFFSPSWFTAIIFGLKPTCVFIFQSCIYESWAALAGRDLKAHGSPLTLSIFLSSSSFINTSIGKKKNWTLTAMIIFFILLELWVFFLDLLTSSLPLKLGE